MGSLKEWSILHVLMCVTFIVSGLAINLVQLLLYIPLKYTNKNLFRTLNYYLVYMIYSQLTFLVDWWAPATLNIYLQTDEFAEMGWAGMGGEHAVILMNHHYELDWLYGWMVADRANILGNGRVYVKKMLQYIPIIGWAWSMSDVVFLERNWEKDKDNLARKLNNLLDFPSPVWLLIFPEGTRMSKEKHAASQEFAVSRGLPELKHHLVPRTKGFSFTVSRLDPARLRVVYDVTIVAGGEDSAPPTLTSVLQGRRTVANLYIRKFYLKDIPKDDEGSSAWLMNLFKEKDALKESFMQTGSFSKLSGLPVHEKIQHETKLYSLLVFSVLNCCVHIPLFYTLIFGGTIVRILLLGVLLLSWLAMQRLVNITKISKSSSYGKSPTSTTNAAADKKAA